MKLLLAQTENSSAIEKNIEVCLAMIERYEAEYYVFAECALTGYTSDDSARRYLTPDSPYLGQLLSITRQKGIHLFTGAYMIDAAGNKRIAYLYIGKQCQIYYKTHLGIKERATFLAGDQLKVFDDPYRMGVALCIESHFPDIALSLRLRGANCLLVPFASPRVCGSRQALWSKYLAARAYDNQMYLVATNLVGRQNGLDYQGGMMLIDPRGEVLYSYFQPDRHSALLELDMEGLQQLRANKKVNYINRRRPELYGGNDELY